MYFAILFKILSAYCAIEFHVPHYEIPQLSLLYINHHQNSFSQFFLPSEVEAAVVFPEDEDREAEELLAVLRLTIQNKRTAFNKTKNVTATATPTTTSSEVPGKAAEAKE